VKAGSRVLLGKNEVRIKSLVHVSLYLLVVQKLKIKTIESKSIVLTIGKTIPIAANFREIFRAFKSISNGLFSDLLPTRMNAWVAYKIQPTVLAWSNYQQWISIQPFGLQIL
jgi:hypothetical protein